jgi:poly-gamma-glutamate capsule biosynthesis protein CapA/YwtB (metallophosphatase superfamily)
MKLIKNLFFIIFILFILGGGLFLYFKQDNWKIDNIFNQTKEILEIDDTDQTITLAFVGDIMLSRAVGDKMAEKENWKWPFLETAEKLKNVDIAFGNLEGGISDKGMNVGSIYSFRADPRAIQGLEYAGFDILSVANNHMGDWAAPAFEDTLNRLTASGIDYVGGGFNQQEAYSPLKKELKDTSLCFFAYTDLGPRSFGASNGNSGMAFLEIEAAAQDVEKYEDECDLTIVSLHFGNEYETNPTMRQKTVAQTLTKAGTDLIIGHHSHVIGNMEEIDGTSVFYSLGNFVFDQMFSQETRKGMLLIAEVRNKKLVNLIPHEVYINDDYQPALINGS